MVYGVLGYVVVCSHVFSRVGFGGVLVSWRLVFSFFVGILVLVGGGGRLGRVGVVFGVFWGVLVGVVGC